MGVPGRFTHLFREFERQWQTTEPVHQGDGSSSSASTRCGRGGTSPAVSAPGSSQRAAELLAGAPGGALRVVVLHHHSDRRAPGAPRKKPVARRSHVLAALVDAGAELILAGHIHQAAVSERHEFEVAPGSLRAGDRSPSPPGWDSQRALTAAAKPAACTSTKPTSTSSSSRRTYGVRIDWGLTAVRRFPAGASRWKTEPSLE